MGLFEVDVPNGFQYRDEFISAGEESDLAGEISRVEFSNFEMRGVVARRRVAFFGRSYEETGTAPPIPAFLLPLRDRVAEWIGVAADAFAMALINEYRSGAPIGWHRDAPQYDIVAGISLLSACRMRFRPYVSPAAQAKARGGTTAAVRRATHDVALERRSAYVLAGEARTSFEHHIPAVAALRYSITFRTLRS